MPGEDRSPSQMRRRMAPAIGRMFSFTNPFFHLSWVSYAPCMVYFPLFSYIWLRFMVNVSKSSSPMENMGGQNYPSPSSKPSCSHTLGFGVVKTGGCFHVNPEKKTTGRLETSRKIQPLRSWEWNFGSIFQNLLLYGASFEIKSLQKNVTCHSILIRYCWYSPTETLNQAGVLTLTLLNYPHVDFLDRLGMESWNQKIWESPSRIAPQNAHHSFDRWINAKPLNGPPPSMPRFHRGNRCK